MARQQLGAPAARPNDAVTLADLQAFAPFEPDINPAAPGATLRNRSQVNVPLDSGGGSKILSAWSPKPRTGRYINLGSNSFGVAYGTDTRDEFNAPAGPYTTNVIAPGEEWFETGVTAPLFARSVSGTNVECIIEMDPDRA